MEKRFSCKSSIVSNRVEMACLKMGLDVTMKGALKSLTPNVHWHFKKGKEPGVLEITLLLNENKLILSCKKNRGGDWVKQATESLKQVLELLED